MVSTTRNNGRKAGNYKPGMGIQKCFRVEASYGHPIKVNSRNKKKKKKKKKVRKKGRG